MAWISDNIANLAILLIIALLIFLAVRKMIRDKKSGKTCCSGCSDCPHNGNCH